MSTTIYRAGGALTNEHDDIYIKRQADRATLTHLRVMDYLLVIEPRQQGKTSLINHLMCRPALSDVAFAYVDVTTPDRSTEATWYQTLCPRILRQLRSFIPRKQWPAIPQNSAGWREFLCDVATFAIDAHRRVVVALDEIGAVTFPGATEFFSVLRDVYNSRQAEPELKQLTFLLAGAFHPRDLIKDDKISPFNIAQRVRLTDFALAQVRELVNRGTWADEQATNLAERIHYWTDGQPYLTQLLCSYLGPDATPANVDAGVERLRQEDENHLPPMLDRLNGDEKLHDYVQQIITGEHIKFYPREHRRQAQLELLGVVKANAQGFCAIRNQISLQALTQLGIFSPQVPQVLLDFTSTQSLIEQEWQSYGSQAETVQRTLEYDDSLRKLVLVKKGHGFDAAARYKHPNHPPLGWKCQYYELLVRMSPESVVCVNVLDKTGENRTLLYSLEILPGLNQWSEFQIPLDQGISDGDWHALLIDLPKHMEEAQWPVFKTVNWISLRGELSLAGIRGCNNEDSLVASAAASPHIVQSSSATKHVVPLDVAPASQGVMAVSIPELAEALQRRTLAVFIGADLPREVTGLPSRADLTSGLARRMGLDESLVLAEVVQRVGQAGNRWEFTAVIRNELDTTGKSPQPFHQRIVALVKEHQIETIVTTAYDNLLELAFQEAGIGINRVVRGSDVSFINPDRPTLIKLYGDAHQPDTLVVTEDDHYGLWQDRDKEDLLHQVRSILRRRTVLFLGYNLADPDFHLLRREVLDRAGRFARTAYAVWSGLPQEEVQMWRDRGIIILDTDPLGVLEAMPAASSLASTAEGNAISTERLEGSSRQGGEMDHERGLQALKECVAQADPELRAELSTLEDRLHQNKRAERIFGSSENTRNERAQIIFSLNEFALKHCGASFNDLCAGKSPKTVRFDELTEAHITVLMQELKALLIDANTAERKASEQLWLAVQQNRVEQGEIAATVDALRRWARSIQRTGLPMDDEMRTAILSLTQPAEGVDGMYNYLHFALPLLPGLLSVESEIDLNKLWAEVKERWGQKQGKGDGEAEPASEVFGTGNEWAVLVGVDEYEDKSNYGELHVCVKDANAIRQRLMNSGFDSGRIRLLADDAAELPSRDNILTVLKAVADATEPDDLLLFYYSGHGDEVDGESYLVARNGRRLVLSDTAVRVSRIKEIMQEAPARAKVIILDACHSGADIGGKGPQVMSEAFIRRVFEEAEGLAILASCKQNQFSYEWQEEGQSAFTHFLLEAWAGEADRDEKGFVTVQDTNRHVSNGVKLWASQHSVSQTPTLQYSVAGDIILVRYQ